MKRRGQKQSSKSKTIIQMPADSRRVFGKAGAEAFRELISQIEAGISIGAEKPERHFNEAVMEYGPQFKHGMQIRYITGAEYDAFFAREQEAYNREEQEAKEAHLDRLIVAVAWVRLAKDDRVINLINARIKEIGTRITFEPPLTLAFALKKVLTEDASRTTDGIPVEIDAESRETLLNGLHQFKTWINVYYQSMSQTISQCEMPPTCTLESLQDLAAEVGCSQIIDLLSNAGVSSSSEILHAEYFVIPRCFDLLGLAPIALPKQATISEPAPHAESDTPPALAGSRFEISKDFSKVFDKKENKHYTFDNDITRLALAYMSEHCRSKELRKKGCDIVAGVHARYFENFNTKCDGYNSVGEFFRVSKGNGSNRKAALPFYGTLVMNNGRAGMYWMELNDV